MPSEKPYEYVRRMYGVDPVIGQRVSSAWGGDPSAGVIVRKRHYDQYVHVKFDGSSFDVPVHPLELNYETGSAPQQSSETSDSISDPQVQP